MRAQPSVVSEATLLQIAEAIEGVRFGSVQITIHDARVVQIEATQKIRLDHKAHLLSGGRTNHPSFADQTAGGKRPFIEHNGHASGVVLPTH
ncbi:MAG: YezD family protein [Candidatus Omnitrophica bacterium]|nr:YezD family protein [Candidatus Omnitrophota bacterium]